ncbi:MAG: ABC transporter ATP-binding protein, partial [Thiohalocapsa sp.]
MSVASERAHTQTRFRDLLGYVTPHAGVLLLGVVLMLAESAVALINPWIAGRFAELLLPAPTAVMQGLWELLAVWAGLLAAQSVLSFGNRYLLGSTGETLLAALRARLYDHLQALPIGYFHQRRRGEVLALLGNDAEYISSFVTGTLVGLLPLLVTFVGAAYMMYRISPSIAGIALVAVPLFFLVTKLIGRRIRPLTSEWVRSHAEMFATLEENIGMLPAIKSFTREAHESDRFGRSNTRLLRIAKRQLLLESLLTPSVHLIAGLGLLLLLYLSTLQVQSGALPATDLVSVLLYGMLLTRPGRGLAGVYGSVQMARGAAQRLLEVFDVRPEPQDIGAPALPPVSGRLQWQDIHFAYPNRAPVFAGFDLEIGAGETVALTGDNGSGKSTLIHLLMRFADPDAGRVLIDGLDVRSVSIASLRRQIGLV